MRIDVHTHIDDYYGVGFSHKGRLADMKQCMSDAKIDKAIILQDIDLEDPLTAAKLLDLIQNEPDLYMMATIVVTDRTADDLRELDALVKHDKVVGIKLYPGYEDFYPNDGICDPIYDICEQADVPVVFHTGDTLGSKVELDFAHPRHIDSLALTRPNLKIIMAHLGCPFFDDAMTLLTRHKNVYADLSGLTLKFHNNNWVRYAKDAVNKVIAWCEHDIKLLFGTDWFCNDDLSEYRTFMSDYVTFIKTLNVSPEGLNRIFYKNAQALFGI